MNPFRRPDNERVALTSLLGSMDAAHALTTGGRFNDAVPAWRSVVAAARRWKGQVPDPDTLLAYALYFLASAEAATSEFHAAIAHFKEEAVLREKRGERGKAEYAWEAAARAARDAHEIEKAEHLAREAMRVARESNDPITLSRSTSLVGQCLAGQGQTEAAKGYLEQAAAIPLSPRKEGVLVRATSIEWLLRIAIQQADWSEARRLEKLLRTAVAALESPTEGDREYLRELEVLLEQIP
jgi:tetratricopeptide (TPR) repeat protein